MNAVDVYIVHTNAVDVYIVHTNAVDVYIIHIIIHSNECSRCVYSIY